MAKQTKKSGYSKRAQAMLDYLNNATPEEKQNDMKDLIAILRTNGDTQRADELERDLPRQYEIDKMLYARKHPGAK